MLSLACVPAVEITPYLTCQHETEIENQNTEQLHNYIQSIHTVHTGGGKSRTAQ